MSLFQTLVCAAAGTTLAVLAAFAVARVVNDTMEDGGEERPNGDSFPAPLISTPFHESEYRIRSKTE